MMKATHTAPNDYVVASDEFAHAALADTTVSYNSGQIEILKKLNGTAN